MTQYNTFNVKLSNWQLNKLNKNGTEVTFELPSNVADDSNDQNNFSHEILFTNTQVLRLRKVFTNGSSVNIKL